MKRMVACAIAVCSALGGRSVTSVAVRNQSGEPIQITMPGMKGGVRLDAGKTWNSASKWDSIQVAATTRLLSASWKLSANRDGSTSFRNRNGMYAGGAPKADETIDSIVVDPTKITYTLVDEHDNERRLWYGLQGQSGPASEIPAASAVMQAESIREPAENRQAPDQAMARELDVRYKLAALLLYDITLMGRALRDGAERAASRRDQLVRQNDSCLQGSGKLQEGLEEVLRGIYRESAAMQVLQQWGDVTKALENFLEGDNAPDIDASLTMLQALSSRISKADIKLVAPVASLLKDEKERMQVARAIEASRGAAGFGEYALNPRAWAERVERVTQKEDNRLVQTGSYPCFYEVAYIMAPIIASIKAVRELLQNSEELAGKLMAQDRSGQWNRVFRYMHALLRLYASGVAYDTAVLAIEGARALIVDGVKDIQAIRPRLIDHVLGWKHPLMQALIATLPAEGAETVVVRPAPVKPPQTYTSGTTPPAPAATPPTLIDDKGQPTREDAGVRCGLYRLRDKTTGSSDIQRVVLPDTAGDGFIDTLSDAQEKLLSDMYVDDFASFDELKDEIARRLHVDPADVVLRRYSLGKTPFILPRQGISFQEELKEMRAARRSGAEPSHVLSNFLAAGGASCAPEHMQAGIRVPVVLYRGVLAGNVGGVEIAAMPGNDVMFAGMPRNAFASYDALRSALAQRAHVPADDIVLLKWSAHGVRPVDVQNLATEIAGIARDESAKLVVARRVAATASVLPDAQVDDTLRAVRVRPMFEAPHP